MSFTSRFLTRALITTRLIYVASPEYRKEKEAKRLRKEDAQKEMDKMIAHKPIYFIIGLLFFFIGVICFSLPNVSSWWVLPCAILMFGSIIAGMESYYKADNAKRLEHSRHIPITVNSYNFLERYKKYGTIPPEVEAVLIKGIEKYKEFNFDISDVDEHIIKALSDFVQIPKWVVDACEEAEKVACTQID